MPDATTQYCRGCLTTQPEEQFLGSKTYKFPEGKPNKTCNKCRARKVGKAQYPFIAPACEPGTQRCPQCSTTKPVEEFTGVRCTPCRDAFNADRQLRVTLDPEYRALTRRRSQESKRRTGVTKANIGDQMFASCIRCPAEFTYPLAGARRRTLCDLCQLYRQEWLYYRLNGPEAAALHARGACDICGSTSSGATGRPFRIDHCHKTRVVRGLLCHPCNIAIGCMKDQPERLRAAANYVEKYQMATTGDINAF